MWEQPVDVVVQHPRVVDLGRTPREQRRAEDFARDLARWLVGRPREELGALARVITVVAQRELRDTRRLCKDRPLMAVEASARATEALWPLLRGPEEPEEPEPPPEAGDDAPEPAGSGGAAGASGGGEEGEPQDGEPAEAEAEPAEAEPADGDGEASDGPDPLEVLQQLGELTESDDPELDALAEALRERMLGGEDEVDIGAEAAEMLKDMGDAAIDGAVETDRVARHLEHFLPGVGWSSAPGQLELSLLDRLEGLTALLAQLQDLRRIADQLGRLEEATRKKGPREGGREEVVGVRLGGDVATALPSELGLLGDPATEDLFYQRFAERRLVSLELTGAGDEGAAMGDKKGPVIACIDTSASMEGPPELAAKALVLAVCRHVIPRGRPVHLILFGGPGQQSEIRLRRGLGGLEGMLDFLQMSFHSGTDFDGPLLRALDLLEEAELTSADVLVVTDGLCRAAPEVVQRVDEVRQSIGVRVWSIVLGHRDTRGVAPFSDEVWQIEPSETAQAVDLVQRLGRRRQGR